MERYSTFVPQKFWLPHPHWLKSQCLGLLSKERTYLRVSYFLFTCQRSELILSCQLCMFVLNTIPLLFKEVGRGVAFLQFPELLLEIAALRTSPGWGKNREHNLLDIFELKISHILGSVRNFALAFTLAHVVVRHAMNSQESLCSELQQCQRDNSWSKAELHEPFLTQISGTSHENRKIYLKCKVPLEPRWILGEPVIPGY